MIAVILYGSIGRIGNGLGINGRSKMAQKIFDCVMYCYFFFTLNPLLEYLFFHKKKLKIYEQSNKALKQSFDKMCEIADGGFKREEVLAAEIKGFNRILDPITEALKEGKTVKFVISDGRVFTTKKNDEVN